MINNILTSVFEQPWFIVIMLVIFFGVIVLIVIIAKRKLKFLKKDEEKIDEKKMVQDELDRVLQVVEDEDTAKAMEEYEKNQKDDK